MNVRRILAATPKYRAFLGTAVLAGVLVSLVGVTVVSGLGPGDARGNKAELARQADSLPDLVDQAVAAKQREEYNASTALARENERKWLADFLATGVDPRTLERVEIQASFAKPFATLGEAVNNADVIVSGVADKIEFRASLLGEAVVTFKVEEVMKGNPAELREVQIAFGGGPAPYPGQPSKAVLGYLPAAPLLLPGEEAVLLLRKSQTDPRRYIPQIVTGVNIVENGVVKVVEGSPLASLVENRPLADVTNLLRAAAKN